MDFDSTTASPASVCFSTRNIALSAWNPQIRAKSIPSLEKLSFISQEQTYARLHCLYEKSLVENYMTNQFIDYMVHVVQDRKITSFVSMWLLME